MWKPRAFSCRFRACTAARQAYSVLGRLRFSTASHRPAAPGSWPMVVRARSSTFSNRGFTNSAISVDSPSGYFPSTASPIVSSMKERVGRCAAMTLAFNRSHTEAPPGHTDMWSDAARVFATWVAHLWGGSAVERPDHGERPASCSVAKSSAQHQCIPVGLLQVNFRSPRRIARCRARAAHPTFDRRASPRTGGCYVLH